MPRCPRKCSACGVEHGERITLYKFPEDAGIRRQWAEFCKVNVEDVKETTRVCSRHFTPKNFLRETEIGKRRRLQKNAIPTLYRETPPPGEIDSSENGFPLTHFLDEEAALPESEEGGRTRRKRQYCAICGNVDLTNRRISFFRLPADPVIRGKWLESLDMDEPEADAQIRFCSRHFPNGDNRYLPVHSIADPDGAPVLQDVLPGVTNVVPRRASSGVGSKNNHKKDIAVKEESGAERICTPGQGVTTPRCSSSPECNPALPDPPSRHDAPHKASGSSESDTPSVSVNTPTVRNVRRGPGRKRKRVEIEICDLLTDQEEDEVPLETPGTSLSNTRAGSAKTGRVRYFPDYEISLRGFTPLSPEDTYPVSLLSFKSKGRLINPPLELVKVVKEAERLFKAHLQKLESK